jgi:tRNA-dihydrouridine synthase B
MVGRGATQNPWIFSQIAARLSGGAWPEPTLKDRRDLILEHFQAVLDREEPKRALHKLRTFTGWYSHGLPQGLQLRRQIQGQGDALALFDLMRRFLDQRLQEAA